MIHGTHSGIRTGRIDELYVQCRDWKCGWIRPLSVLQGGFRSSGRDQVAAVGTGWVVAAVFCVLSLSVDESRKSSGFKMRTRVGWGLARSVSRSFLSR